MYSKSVSKKTRGSIGSSFCINADTARFAYDPAGNVARADNRYARVRRGYNLGGMLTHDTLIVRTYDEPGDTPCGSAPEIVGFYGGSEWTQHRYVLENSYDLSGRRTSQKQPYYVTGCSAIPCTNSYSYSPATALLESVTDGLGRSTTLGYDNALRVTSASFPSGYGESLTLSGDGQPTARSVSYSGTYAISDALAYDASGRLARGTLGVRNGQTFNEATDSWYSALGAVLATTNGTGSATGGTTTEKFTVDALGNRLWTEQTNIKPSTHPDVNGTRNLTLDSDGRVYQVSAPYYPTYSYTKDVTYDGSGNTYTTKVIETDYYASGSLWDASINYYDAGDRLRGFNRHIGPGSVSDDARPGQRGVFEEYFYDALGRRVMVRSRRGSGCSTSGDAECSSYLERTVWDGDQVAFERRAPGSTSTNVYDMETQSPSGPMSTGYPFGSVGYLHAGGIDQPVAVLRMGMEASYQPELVTVYPHQNWKGIFEVGSMPGGGLTSSCTGGSGCPVVKFPGAATTIDGMVGNPSANPSWFGNLIPGKADGSGLQYMRNRYYDPQTGRFTQEDPIGLAGGMNLYGYAGGDPINFSDPFGLSPDCLVLPCPVVFGAGAALGGPLTIFGAAVLTVLTADLAAGSSSGVFAPSDRAGADATAYRPGGRFTPKTKRQIDQEATAATGQAGTCEYCGITLVPVPGEPNSTEFDHQNAKSKGGDNSPANGRRSCRDCNRKKGDKDVPDPRQRPQQPQQQD
jgi:RHS repeat-associated protein